MRHNELIPPMELKTIEVDIEKKIFRVNGKDFGGSSTGFSIRCEASEDYLVRMRIDMDVHIDEHRAEDEEKQEGNGIGAEQITPTRGAEDY